MRLLFLLLSIFVFTSCSDKKVPLKGETEWQRAKNSQFKDATRSPLLEKDLRTFSGLDFYPYSEDFKIVAQLERVENSEWFNMPTTTSRMSKERLFAVLKFELEGKNVELNIYQGADYLNTPGQEDMLFLPFLDETNGDETYGGGRYIEVRIPEGDKITIDFNEAFNPYCVYNEKFSCPIVPRDNFIPVKVQAGEKKFKKESGSK